MKASLNGLDVDPRSLCVNVDLNYGHFEAHGRDILCYEIRLSHVELVASIGAKFDELVTEMRVDDRNDDEISVLARMNYPTLALALASFPVELAEVIRTFLDRTVLDAFLPFSEHSKFVINSTDVVVVESDNVRLSGRCYRLSGTAPSCA